MRAALVTLFLVAGCATTEAWSTGRTIAANALGCSERELEPVFAHSYNLGPGDYVYRGCGHDAIVACVASPGGAMCRTTFVSE